MDVQAMLSVLDDHGFTDTDLDRKVEALQTAIWDIESREPWPFLEATANLNFDGTNATPSNMPSDFRAAIRLYDRVLRRRVLPKRLDDADEYMAYQDDSVGVPLFYYFEGGELKVWRIPEAGSNRMRLRYLRTSAAIDSNSAESDILIPKRHHKAITFGALYQLYDMEDDPELASRFEGHYENRILRMRGELFQLQFDQADYVHVMDVDAWDYDDLY